MARYNIRIHTTRSWPVPTNHQLTDRATGFGTAQARYQHLTTRETNKLTATQAQTVIAAAILRHGGSHAEVCLATQRTVDLSREVVEGGDSCGLGGVLAAFGQDLIGEGEHLAVDDRRMGVLGQHVAERDSADVGGIEQGVS